MEDAPREGDDAFAFYGDWREFAPIAFTNLLLTIVTLGVYSFWAKARVRRYLWSRTRFVDERLEWTGTGLELFVGYILAFVLMIVPVGAINLLLQGVLLRGHQGAAISIGLILYIALLYLVGVARFRALRYRLSRTFWHGIRGGSDDQGFRYGLSYLWRSLAGMLAAGLLIPWSMTTLWNRRWGAMSFGDRRFAATARSGKLMPRFLLFYLAPILLLIVLLVAGVIAGAFGAAFTRGGGGDPRESPGFMLTIILAAIAFYIVFFGVFGLIALVFYAAFFREAVGALTLGETRFAFTARTKDWVKLFLGNIGIVLATLGIGLIFLPYRNWKFFVDHAAAHDTAGLVAMTRSGTRDPGQGEGLLDAFDVGAF